MTAQIGEVLRYKGEEHSLFSNPLEQHFQVIGSRPNFDGQSTACWRSYVATWEFQDDVLFLTDIIASIERKPIMVADLFPGSGGRVQADWVTDLFQVPQGECVNYVHMGYASTYERDLWLSVWGGRLVLAEVVENQANKRVSSEVTGQLEAVFEPDEASFIRAVRVAPQDRTPRLVYADWLDERNDPRGELIRLEDDLAAANEDLRPAEEWVSRKEAVMQQVKHWLWMKLMDYPLPRDSFGYEQIDW
jgi:uncharacterized protein (TIGR02996 family)